MGCPRTRWLCCMKQVQMAVRPGVPERAEQPPPVTGAPESWVDDRPARKQRAQPGQQPAALPIECSLTRLPGLGREQRAAARVDKGKRVGHVIPLPVQWPETG